MLRPHNISLITTITQNFYSKWRLLYFEKESWSNGISYGPNLIKYWIVYPSSVFTVLYLVLTEKTISFFSVWDLHR